MCILRSFLKIMDHLLSSPQKIVCFSNFELKTNKDVFEKHRSNIYVSFSNFEFKWGSLFKGFARQSNI